MGHRGHFQFPLSFDGLNEKRSFGMQGDYRFAPLATFLQGNGGVQPQPITGDQITMTFLTPFDKQWADFLLKVFIGRSLSQGNTCEKR